MKNSDPTFKIDQSIKNKCFWAIGIGLVALVFSFVQSPVRFWLNFLIDNIYFITIGLSGVFFLAVQFVTGSSWMRPYQRIPQAMSQYLPWALGLMLFLYLGVHYLYEWSHADIVMHDEVLKGKEIYLNIPFFMARMLIIFSGWILFSKLISSALDRIQLGTLDPIKGSGKLSKLSAIFLVFFGISFSFASYDWIMSVEPHWFSTVFSIYTFAGMFVSGIAFITLSLIALQSMGFLKGVINENHYHDLGKWLFGMSTFWAYIWFCQYMLIWYSNIPEETQYFILRNEHSWDWLFWINFVVNWGLPFVVLLPRASKRSTFILSRVCVLLLVGHWLDLYILIAPNVLKHGNLSSYVGPFEVLAALGFAGFFVFIFLKALGKKSIVVDKDLFHDEGLHLHQ